MFKLLNLAALGLTWAARDINPPAVDGSTYANVDEMQVRHMSLVFDVDFDQSLFDGYVQHHIECVKDSKYVVLDIVGIEISKVSARMPYSTVYTPVDYEVRDDLDPLLGEALDVHLPDTVRQGQSLELLVYYKTNIRQRAVSWLTKEQTAGKKMPYLFSQCETIECRSIAPMMDTPSIKVTYDASISVPEEFVVHMSANSTGVDNLPDNKKQYNFKN